MQLSKRVQSVTPSATLAITAKANDLKAQGLDVIGLGAGEPDFNTPAHIIEAGHACALQGFVKYTAASGLLTLKAAIQKKLLDDQKLAYALNEIIVCSGAKHALYTLFQAILDVGDEVIIPTPYWVSYPEFVKLADGTPVFLTATEANDFKITPEQLKIAITPKTKALVLNSPSNPTGMLYSKEELEVLGNICLEHNVLIVSDEIYEKLVYDGNTHVSIAELSPALKENTIIINGVSKSHAMTGWRIGYAVGNKEIISAMTTIASHSTSNPTTISQYAAIAAYEESQQCVEEMRQAFASRLNVIYPKLLEIPGVHCKKPQGAFYLFPNVSETAKLCGYSDVDDFVTDLLKEALVAVVPGSGFGAPENIRLSYATSLEKFEEVLDRMKKFVEKKMQK